MRIKGINRIVLSFILMLTVIPFPFTVTASEAISDAEEKEITVVLSEDGAAIDISWDASAISADTVDIIICPPGKNERAVLSNISVSDEAASLPLNDGEYLYSPFYLGISTQNGYERLTSSVCVSDENLGGDDFKYPSFSSKKGLNIGLISDAQQLGVCHTVLPVELNKLICDASSSSHAITHYNKTYHFDSSYVNSLDHKIKVMSDSGVNVYLQIVLTSPDGDTSKNALSLYGADASHKPHFYGIDLDSGGAELLHSAMAFLALRYSVQDGKYGFAGSFIIGNCVNSNRVSNYIGPLNVSEYAVKYAKAFRCAYTALKSVYSNARVYVPVNGCYTVPVRDISPDASLDYTAKDFLCAFNSQLKAQGDLAWSLSAELFNVYVSSAEFWREDGATKGDDTPFVTMKNPCVLEDLLSSDDMLYNGNKRKITVSACAFSSGENTQEEQRKQAAAYALAYYTAEASGSIEAFIYSEHVDSDNSVCKSAGLYTVKDSAVSITDEKKEIYNVFKYIDTDMSSSVTAKYTSVIGISSYDEAINAHSNLQEKRVVLSGIPVQDIKRDNDVVFDFFDGVCGFYPSDNAKSVTSHKDGKYGYLVCETYNVDVREYRGVCRMLNDTDLSESGYVSFDIAVNAPDSAEYVDVMMLIWGSDQIGRSVIYEGTAQIPTYDRSSLTYDISDFLALTGKQAYGMKIQIKPHSSGDGGNYSATLSNVRFLKENASLMPVVIAVTVSAILVLICIALFFIVRYSASNNRKNKKTIGGLPSADKQGNAEHVFFNKK